MSPSNKPLAGIMAALNKYEVDNFEFEIIEECSKEQLNEREMYWIAYYKSNIAEFGYNLTAGGDHAVGESNTNADLTEKM